MQTNVPDYGDKLDILRRDLPAASTVHAALRPGVGESPLFA